VTRRAGLALLGGALILTLAMGVRQTFGLILTPMGTDLGIGREAFGLALAVQNLLWGAAQPFAGALADRWGAVRVAAVGSLLYAGGLVAMATAADAGELLFGAGVLVGLGLSGVSFAVVLGAVGRAVPADKRSLALGVASAGGSFGQFVMAPVGHALISGQGWAGALMTMAAIALVMAPLALLLAEKGGAGAAAHPGPASAEPVRAVAALSEAGGHRGFWCLTLGFFVCGFQVVFIGVHLPPYLNDLGLAPILGAYALALIGFFNIIGTWGAGVLGGRPLRPAGGGDRRVPGAAEDARGRPRFCVGDRPALARHGAPDQRPRRSDLRGSSPVDAVRPRLFQPPGRQLPRRLARRCRLRSDRLL
jgi:MFS family permease